MLVGLSEAHSLLCVNVVAQIQLCLTTKKAIRNWHDTACNYNCVYLHIEFYSLLTTAHSKAKLSAPKPGGGEGRAVLRQWLVHVLGGLPKNSMTCA